VSSRTIRWSDEFYVRAYQLARQGLADTQIMAALVPTGAKPGNANGSAKAAWRRWLQEKPALRQALAEGRAVLDPEGSAWDGLKDHVYHSLTEDARAVWEEIAGLEDLATKKSALRLFERQGRRLKQQLFLYALFECDFSRTTACRRLHLSQRTVDDWCAEPGFRQLLKGLQECKKDFCESALFRLVKGGDTAAVLFANRTLNRDRGYGDRLDVKVSGKVDHKLTLEQLNLPLEVRKQLLEAMRQRKEQPQEVLEGDYRALPAPAAP
jgi:hypothetical protein